jgi:hypothetical protein
VNFLSQRSMVTASLLRPDTTAEAHGTYARRNLVPEADVRPAIPVEQLSESMLAAPEEPGLDGRRGEPTPCPHCTRGTRIGPNGEAWKCHHCGGTGREPIAPPRARVIPGTDRMA